VSDLRGLLVDYGGVLTNPLTETMGAWLRADGIEPRLFSDLMRRWLSAGSDRNAVHDLETGRLSPR
jgi:putative hydrolase of the HAD superfamily